MCVICICVLCACPHKLGEGIDISPRAGVRGSYKLYHLSMATELCKAASILNH